MEKMICVNCGCLVEPVAHTVRRHSSGEYMMAGTWYEEGEYCPECGAADDFMEPDPEEGYEQD